MLTRDRKGMVTGLADRLRSSLNRIVASAVNITGLMALATAKECPATENRRLRIFESVEPSIYIIDVIL